jgi:hypothetical protein
MDAASLSSLIPAFRIWQVCHTQQVHNEHCIDENSSDKHKGERIHRIFFLVGEGIIMPRVDEFALGDAPIKIRS